MKKIVLSFSVTFLIGLFFFQTPAFAGEVNFTTDRVNFRADATTESAIIKTLNYGSSVEVVENREDGWSFVKYNGVNGYIKTEFLGPAKQGEALQGTVEHTPWQEAKAVFTIGVPAKVTDVRTGLVYYVRSFSNGLHADVEPVTKEDTAIMLKTYNGRWAWDPRPVWVTINGRTMAGSINGMPHGGGVNNSNGMNGQVCIHFKGSTTHNSNKSFAQWHQDIALEAYNASLR